MKSRLAGLDLHGSAIKWVAEFESRSVFGRLFRKWILVLKVSLLFLYKRRFKQLKNNIFHPGIIKPRLFSSFCRNSRFILKILDPDSLEMKTDFEK
jgi:hypothetical protein